MGEGQNLGRLAPKEAGSKADGAVELHQSYMMSKRCRGARRKMQCIVQVVGKNSRFLHDAISDLFVELLKVDLKSLSVGKLGEISLASKWCPTIDSSYNKASLKTGKAKIAAGALLPHEIIGALNDEDGGEVAELQRKRMVDDMVKKGKLSDCIAVCDVSGEYGRDSNGSACGTWGIGF